MDRYDSPACVPALSHAALLAGEGLQGVRSVRVAVGACAGTGGLPAVEHAQEQRDAARIAGAIRARLQATLLHASVAHRRGGLDRATGLDLGQGRARAGWRRGRGALEAHLPCRGEDGEEHCCEHGADGTVGSERKSFGIARPMVSRHGQRS